ncbi:hypothetical protein C7M84_018394 [Penaeus vannamei]|uniref:Uncharacterized protein n=1 Tax=Penaeus vannamei TaxID=6689 RepID=A0A423SHS1_PENVA|nr:hypothetical protein C7M84_018394 [Penaeus vannamei]
MHSVCALLQQGILVLLLVTSGILCSSRRDTEAVSNAFSSTTSSSEHLDTRFPPRHYSFDPRPNIDLSALVSGESASTLTSLKVDDNFQGDTSTENSNKGNSVAGHPEVSASPEGITDQNDGSTRTHADEKLEEGPRAIVDVQRQSLSGVSYIIHPDNLPPPSYEPLKDLPPPSHPVAQWRPDLFIKVCCSPSNETISDSNENSTLIDIHTGYAEIGNKTDPENKGTEEVDGEGEPVGSYLLNDEETVKYSSDGEKTLNISQDKLLQNCGALQEGSEKCRDSNDNKAGDSVDVDDFASTEIPGNDEGQLEPTATSERSSSNFTQLVVELGALGDAANKHFLDASSNHTPRYEESGSTTYQDMANFLKDIANSDGFQNAFLGDLISNFGSLDQNAMKLIYSLLIRPLEAAHQGIKTDRMGASPNTKLNSPNHLPSPSMTPDFLMLNKDKLPLRDEPANGYHPFFLSPPQKSPTIGPARAQLRPSPTVQAVASGYSDQAWLPTRSLPRKPSDGLRGDENVDVITAPPFQNFEVVLGSSLNHDGKSKSHPQAPQPSQGASQHPLPFDKLRLGLEMPPPDALEALPPGSVLIPPSYILKQAKLPQIITKKDGTPGLEMSFPDFLPNLPFFGNDKPQRMQPPAKPQAHDIPPRLPSFLSSFLSGARPHSRPEKGPPVRQRPLNRHMFLPRRPPTAPPPPVTKLTPPATRIPTRALPTAIVTSLSPTFTPPPPPVSYVPHKPIDQETPNVLPNSVNPSGLSVAGPIPVPVFVSVPPKKDSVAAASPAQVQSGGPSMHHEESPQKDHMDKVHYQIESASTTGNVVIGEGEAQSPKDYPLIYEEYPDAASHDNSSDTNYHNHEYYEELLPDYILEYYDYQDYYDQQLRRDGLLKTGSSSEVKSGSSDSDTLHNQEASHTSAITNETNASDDHDGLYSPSVSFEPEISPTLSEQEQSDLQMLLQNHQMAAALAEANSTVLSINSTQIGVQSTTKEPDTEFMDDHDYYDVPITSQRGNPYLAHPPPSAPSFPSAPSPSEPLPPAESLLPLHVLPLRGKGVGELGLLVSQELDTFRKPTHPLHTPHQQESFRYRTESSMESEELKHRSSREHRYTAEKTGKEDAQERMHSGRRPRYVVSSLESEELNDHLGHSEREPCTTDSEAEDRTTHYDEDDSRDPSCYTGHSRELDDTVASRGAAPVTSMTSQELGDHLSRDLKQYQTRRSRQHQEDKREAEGDEGTHGEELQRSQSQVSFSRDNVQNEVFLEFDNIFRQHGQYLSGDPIPPASTLGRVSRRTTDTLLSVSRANTPDSIDMSHHHSFSHHRDHRTSDLPSPPTTPPRFSPPPAPPRPPKPGHLSQPGTPSPKANRARPPSPGEAPPSPPRHQHPSGNRNSEEERLI